MDAVQTDLAAAIAALAGEASLVPAARLASYAVDGKTPQAAVMPDSADQVAKLLAFADGARLAVVPWGGGTAMSVGGIPRRVDIVLSTERLNKVLDYSPEDLTVTVQAGVTLAQVQALLAAHEQMLPLDPPLPGRATLGGILATNASGPLRYQYGMPRDLALGMLVAYADGVIAKSGGRTVKNVAGYDMTRLHIGAYGTLGVIVEATFKVSPIPKMYVTVAGSFSALAGAVAAARALRMARIVPWSLVLLGPGTLPAAGSAYTVAVRLGGQPAVIGPQAQRAIETLTTAQGTGVAEVSGAEETFWPAVRDWPGSAGGEGVLLRVGVAPSHTGDVMAGLQNLAGRHNLQATLLAYPGAATVYCHLAGAAGDAQAAIDGVVAVVKEWSGNLTIEHCPLQMKQSVSVWGPASADALTQRVKQTFDPKGTLNPGRFVGTL